MLPGLGLVGWGSTLDDAADVSVPLRFACSGVEWLRDISYMYMYNKSIETMLLTRTAIYRMRHNDNESQLHLK